MSSVSSFQLLAPADAEYFILFVLDIYHITSQLIASQVLKMKRYNLKGVHPVNTLDRVSMDKPHRTIMVIGETGTGKTTLLNSMMNYLWNVEYNDPYRFKLIYETLKEHGDAQSVTDDVTAYHLAPPVLDYELTVIDTPGFGDTRGLAQDQQITKKIKKFFEEKIQEIDAICFVVRASQARLTATQKYIFSQVLGIFGKDIADNILILMTFADGKKPPVLQALKAGNVPFTQSFKLNNSAFDLPEPYDEEEDDDDDDDMFNRMFWEMGISSFDGLFKSINKLQTKSLRSTKQVLLKRTILENHIKSMQPFIDSGFVILERLRGHITEIKKYEDIINSNKNFTYTIQVSKARQIPNNGSFNTTTCLECNFTCHHSCPYSDNADKSRCSSFDGNGYCRICPSKCHWSLHKNKPYTVQWYKEEQMRTTQGMKDKHDAALNKKSGKEQEIKALLMELKQIEQTLDGVIGRVCHCLGELMRIALKPNVSAQDDYIDTLIRSEEMEKPTGWQQRIKSLKELKKKQNILDDLVNQKYNPWSNYQDVAHFLVTNHDVMKGVNEDKSNKKWISFVL